MFVLAQIGLGFVVGPWEMLMILAVAALLLGASGLPSVGRSLRQGRDEFRKAIDQVVREIGRAVGLPMQEQGQMARLNPSRDPGLAVWLAQGLGIGRAPRAPGTFGSVAGLVWFALLLVPGNAWVYAGGLVAGFCFSVWCCGTAERRLGQTDPASVVLDEIVAMPLCFLTWVGWVIVTQGTFPTPGRFFSVRAWLPTLGVFLLFRFFDVAKPWPVRQSQALPGGWGVTVDDTLAAGYVNLVVLLVMLGDRLVWH